MSATLAKLGHHAACADSFGWPGALVIVALTAFLAFVLWLCSL